MQKLSRSKVELFLECPRCFWLDVAKGIKRPPPAPYTINSAIDYLLKQEFDVYRKKGEPHPIMVKHGVEAIPFAHKDIDTWRHNFTGVSHVHKPTGIHVFGAVDDVWINPNGELHVVDYKATGANQHNVYDSYQRQMEVYQWLLRRNGHEVSPTGYFVFARVDKGGGFSGNGKGGGTALLPFNIFVESYTGDDSWVEEAIMRANETLKGAAIPSAAEECEYCKYREAGT
ncbi:MAG: PD-(D/E)XK nuclease family protein [Candidatus Liptonbacteria bacterium]|nr:PD-(D/E)XK nuclease family protein [Candidatus Liptonbacteria bacterium]